MTPPNPPPEPALMGRRDGLAPSNIGSAERFLSIDLARSLALLGMASFHLAYDLEMFGWLTPGTAASGWFWYHARIVAGSFIFLAGLGLWMAHGAGIRWPSFWRRQAKIVAAALLVSLVTYVAMPGMMIFYGILHAIALSSLVGLVFLRLPWALNLGAAVLVFALPYGFSHSGFGGLLIWTGLSGQTPITADFEPFFPWFAPFLAGLASGQILSRFALWPQLRLTTDLPWLRVLAWPGKHSLAVYLIHQPVLLALVSAVSFVLRG